MPEDHSSVEIRPAAVQLGSAIQARLERDFSFDSPYSWHDILRHEQQTSGESMAVQAVRTGLINPFEIADTLIADTLGSRGQHLDPTNLRLKYHMLLNDHHHELYGDFLGFVKSAMEEQRDGAEISREEEVFMRLGMYANSADIYHLVRSYLVHKTISEPGEVNTTIEHMRDFYRFLFSEKALRYIHAAQTLDDHAHITPYYVLGRATEPAYQDFSLPVADRLHATTQNQDAMVCLVLTVGGQKVTLIGVADGISGSGLKPDYTRNSQIASSATVRLLAYHLQQMKEPLIPESLQRAFAQVNADIWADNEAAKTDYISYPDDSSGQRVYSTPSTTLCAMLLSEHQAIVGSVGDSYLSLQQPTQPPRQLIEPDKVGGSRAPIVRFIGQHPDVYTSNSDNC